MRLPSGELGPIAASFLANQHYAILGCLSFEPRCCAVPERLAGPDCVGTHLLDIRDPPNVSPEYDQAREDNTKLNADYLSQKHVVFSVPNQHLPLLAAEDDLLGIIEDATAVLNAPTLVLDITSFPKRYFCFIIKRLLRGNQYSNIIVTCTAAGPHGYTAEHLAFGAQSSDHLPGFAAPPPVSEQILVVSIGFELLSMRSLMQNLSETQRPGKIIVSFPPNGEIARRLWRTLQNMVGSPHDLANRIEAIAAWDAETVYRYLHRWGENAAGLVLAPFGPKAHSLAMCLYGVAHDECGLYYTQPTAYHPEYTKDAGKTWAYVVKWEGIPCFDRPSAQL